MPRNNSQLQYLQFVPLAVAQAIDWHGNQWACFGDKIMSWHLYQKGEGPPPPAFEKLRGCTFWEHLEADPQLHSNFSRAMQNVDSMGNALSLGDHFPHVIMLTWSDPYLANLPPDL